MQGLNAAVLLRLLLMHMMLPWLLLLWLMMCRLLLLLLLWLMMRMLLLLQHACQLQLQCWFQGQHQLP